MSGLGRGIKERVYIHVNIFWVHGIRVENTDREKGYTA